MSIVKDPFLELSYEAIDLSVFCHLKVFELVTKSKDL